MSRWGEEEKKSKGLFGCFFAFGVLGLFCLFAYRNYVATETRRELEKQVQKIVRGAHRQNEQQVHAEINKVAERLDVILEAGAVDVVRTKDDGGNYIFEVSVDYPLVIDFFVFERRIDIPIYERVVLVEY